MYSDNWGSEVLLILTFNKNTTLFPDCQIFISSYFLKHDPFLELLQGKSAEEVQLKIERIITENQLTIHTLTTDNGKEFAKHKELSERLHFDYYFAHPYHSWEIGLNENYNRLLRHYFPKGYDFSFITEERLKEVQEILNTRPRKRFGFLSPKQVYLQTINNNGKVTFIS